MAFSAMIAHRISRDTPSAAVNIQTRDNNFTLNGTLEELGYELKIQFIRKGGKQYGRFSTDSAEFPLASWISEYRNGRLGFESLSNKAMQHLKLEIEKHEIFIDGYIIFIVEKIEAGDILYLYFLEHMSGLFLNTELDMDESRYLDTTGFSLAAKINLLEMEAGESATYVALMRSRGEKELADAFTRLIGFSDKHDLKSDTVEFLNIVDNFSATLDEPTAKITKAKVIDYCLEQNKAGKPVVIADLSQSLSTETKHYEPEHFSRFVENKQQNIKNEFIADSSQLRNYVRISGRNDSLSMSFASECLGKEILYDENSDILTIKNIPPALKARLLKHLKNQ